jgi:hypothetical protein
MFVSVDFSPTVSGMNVEETTKFMAVLTFQLPSFVLVHPESEVPSSDRVNR